MSTMRGGQDPKVLAPRALELMQNVRMIHPMRGWAYSVTCEMADGVSQALMSTGFATLARRLPRQITCEQLPCKQ